MNLSLLSAAAGPVAILALAFLAHYGAAMRGGFIWDDIGLIQNNELLRSPGGLAKLWLEPGSMPEYYPLTHTTWWLHHRLTGLDTFPHHLGNVLLHALNSALLWAILRRMRVPGAWLAGALFAVHPVHVESVAWMSERKNVLSALFYLGSVYGFVAFQSSGGRWRYASSLVLFALAILSKTATVVLPAVLLLVLWWMEPGWSRRKAMQTAPFWVLAALGAAMTLYAESQLGQAGIKEMRPIAERLVVAGWVPWFYAYKLLLPFELSPVYGLWDVNPAAFWSYLPGALLLGLFALFWARRETWGRPAFVASGVFTLSLFPVMGFFYIAFQHFSFVADHFQYLASMAFLAAAAALAASAAARLPGRDAARRTALGVAAALALAPLAFASRKQSEAYTDEVAFWTLTSERTPGSWAAQSNMGVFAMRDGRYLEARDRFREAVRIWPDYQDGLANLAMFFATCPDSVLRDPEEAVRVAERLCAGEGRRTPLNLYTLGAALHSAKRREEALRVLEEALGKVRGTNDRATEQTIREGIAQVRAELEVFPGENGE